MIAAGPDAGSVSFSSPAHDVSPSIGLDPLTASQQKNHEPVEAENTNIRKRKHSHAPPEEYDALIPRTARLTPGFFADRGYQVSSSRVPLSSRDLDAQSRLSPPTESPSADRSDQAMGDNGMDKSDPLRSIFSKITPKQVAQVRSTGDHLLLPDLATFLERHSQTWTTCGFWNAPSWKINESSTIAAQPNRAGLMTYLESLTQEDETRYLKLSTTRVLLHLFYVREAECERRRGSSETVVKKKATNNLCSTIGLGPVEAKKLRMSFHNNKRLGEYWWWFICYFGPGFLLRCSKEAANKMLVPFRLLLID